MVNTVADMQTHNLEHAELPWPQRLQPFSGVDLGPFTAVKDARAMVQYAAASTVRQEARNTALVRGARIAIAIERARESEATAFRESRDTYLAQSRERPAGPDL